MLQMRNAVDCNFDRNRDLLLHFFGCSPRPLGNDLYVVISYVGVGLYRQIVERDDAPDQ